MGVIDDFGANSSLMDAYISHQKALSDQDSKPDQMKRSVCLYLQLFSSLSGARIGK
jgi:hypothetical protein